MRKEGEKSKNSKSSSEPYFNDDLPSYKDYEELRNIVITGVGSLGKARILRHNLKLIDTDEQKKEALEFLGDCLRNEDGAAKKEVLAIQKEIKDVNTLKSGNWTIFFKDPEVVIPALDILPDGTLIVTVPFPAQTTEIDRKGNTRVRQDLLNFVVTSNQEVFLCSDSEFTQRKIFAKIPDTIIRSRWPMKSRKEFLSGDYHRDPYEVFKKITGQFEKYIDFGENRGASVFCSLYAILTYFFILFDSIPYLKFEGMKGSGKSKAGTIFLHIGFNAVMAVSMTAASIFRIVQDERSTLIMDETENYGSDSEKFQEIQPILNSGWQRTGNAPRVEGSSGNRKTVSYSTYSPKIFCSINPILETLRDRSYVINLIRTLDESRANLSVKAKDPIWGEIRSDLYILMFEYYQEVQELADSEDITNDLELIGRDWDKAKPIITLAQFISKYAGNDRERIRTDIVEFLKQQRQEDEEIAENSIEFTIIKILEEKVIEGLEAIMPEKRTDDYPVTVQLMDFSLQVASFEGLNTTKLNPKSYSRKVGRKLRSMGLKRNSRVAHGNYAVFDCTLSDIRTAKQRYKIISQDLTNLTNPTNPTNLNNYTNPLKDEENSQDVSEVSEVSVDLKEKEILGGEVNSHPGKDGVSNEKTVKKQILDILTKLSSVRRVSRVDPHEIIDAWPSTSQLPCPGWNDLYENFLPTMAAEGLLRISNGFVEVRP